MIGDEYLIFLINKSGIENPLFTVQEKYVLIGSNRTPVQRKYGHYSTICNNTIKYKITDFGTCLTFKLNASD